MTVVPRGWHAMLLVVQSLRTLQLVGVLKPASSMIANSWALQRLLILPIATVVLLWLLNAFVDVLEVVAVRRTPLLSLCYLLLTWSFSQDGTIMRLLQVSIGLVVALMVDWLDRNLGGVFA